MSSDRYQDLRRIVREELQSLRMPELAVVQETHPHSSDDDTDNYACTVFLQSSRTVLTRVPLMVTRKGAVSIPDIGDLVIVQYLKGDANGPVIMGTFYNDEDRPPTSAAGDLRFRIPFDAIEGEGVDLHVTSGDTAGVTLNIGASLKVELKDDDPVVLIDVGDGQARMTIESDGTLSLKIDGAINFEGQDITLKGSSITAEAQGELTLKGATINLN